MMIAMSFSETIFLFFLALVIFGPKKLPEIARQVGKWMNELRRASNEFKSQIEQEIGRLDVDTRQTILPPTPPVEGTTSRTLSVLDAEPVIPNPAPAAQSSGTESPAHDSPEHDSPEHESPAPATSVSSAIAEPSSAASEPAPAAEAVTTSSSQETHA